MLLVSVNEPNAEVRVDVKVVGRSPHVGPIELAEGPHLVEVALEGCAPQRREVQLHGGQQQSAAFTLVCVQPPTAAPVASTSIASRQPFPSVGTAQRVVGYSMGGLGLAGLGAGIVRALAGSLQKRLPATRASLARKMQATRTTSTEATARTKRAPTRSRAEGNRTVLAELAVVPRVRRQRAAVRQRARRWP